jgi:hypothetical protein
MIVAKHIFHAALLLSVLSADGRAQEAAPEEEGKPYAYVQILNGIAPPKVALLVDGRVPYPALSPGARITSFGLPKNTWTLKLTKDGSEAEKEFTLKFPRGGFYTVVLTGDFAELPAVASPDGTKKPDHRVKASFLANKKPGGANIDVRVVNGTTKESVRLLRGGKEQCVAAPGESATAEAQPAKDLFMEAVVGNEKIPLAIAQEDPASNLTIVFYESGSTVGFRAMKERWGNPDE